MTYYSSELDLDFPDEITALKAELQAANRRADQEQARRLEVLASRDQLRADLAKLAAW